MFDAQREFKFAPTVIANVLLQVVVISVAFFALEHIQLQKIVCIASALYWLMILYVARSRDNMRSIDKLAMLYGYGFLLPSAAILLYLWRIYN